MSVIYCHRRSHTDSWAPRLTLFLHALVLATLLWKVPKLSDGGEWVCWAYWYSLERPIAVLAVCLFLSASYRDPGFIKPVDLHEQKRLAEGALSDDRGHKQDSDAPEYAVSPAKLMETLNSPKNAKFIKEVLDSTSLPPASPKKDKYHQLTEPHDGNPGQIELSEVGPKPELFENQSQAIAGRRTDSGSEDDHGEDIRAPQNSVIFIPENLKHEDYVVVEKRVCGVCNFEQPLRTKHCKDCGKCVALHDHHCPWLGNCVGERNRFWFYWYLVSEDALLWLSISLVVATQTIDSFQPCSEALLWATENAPRVLCCAVTGLFTVMVTSLWLFHSYLAATNLTTCELYAGETMSWEKISYLKSWPSKLGSPFTLGCLRNLRWYCCDRLQLPYREWTMPKRLPPTRSHKCPCL